jgi:hypothetical protein
LHASAAAAADTMQASSGTASTAAAAATEQQLNGACTAVDAAGAAAAAGGDAQPSLQTLQQIEQLVQVLAQAGVYTAHHSNSLKSLRFQHVACAKLAARAVLQRSMQRLSQPCHLPSTAFCLNENCSLRPNNSRIAVPAVVCLNYAFLVEFHTIPAAAVMP